MDFLPSWPLASSSSSPLDRCFPREPVGASPTIGISECCPTDAAVRDSRDWVVVCGAHGNPRGRRLGRPTREGEA